MNEWKILYEIDNYIVVKNVLLISGVKIFHTENKLNAEICISAQNQFEAENIADEKMDDVLIVLGSELKQKIFKKLLMSTCIGDELEPTRNYDYLNVHVKIRNEISEEKKRSIEKQIKLYKTNDCFKKVMLLRNKKNPNTWENMYKIYEVISKEAGNNAFFKWVSKNDIDNFKHTANHPEGAGVTEARHAHLTTEPPSKPMLHKDAIKLIDNIFYEWVKTLSA